MRKWTKTICDLAIAAALLVPVAHSIADNDVRISETGLSLIRHFEGFVSKAKPDAITGAAPWSYGFGFTRTAHGRPVTPNDTISKAEAERRLSREVQSYCAGAIQKIDPAHRTQNRVDAAASFCWNAGVIKFSRSIFYRRWAAGDIDGAARALRYWTARGTKAEAHLRKRRSVEERLFRASTTHSLGNLD